MSKTGIRIPITAVKDIANKFGYTQVIIHAYDGVTGMQCVATYGKTLKDCENAVKGGNMLKKFLGFPEEMCNTMPKRSKKKTIVDSNENFNEIENV